MGAYPISSLRLLLKEIIDKVPRILAYSKIEYRYYDYHPDYYEIKGSIKMMCNIGKSKE
jgi:hypothetical protein